MMMSSCKALLHDDVTLCVKPCTIGLGFPPSMLPCARTRHGLGFPPSMLPCDRARQGLGFPPSMLPRARTRGPQGQRPAITK